MEEQPKSSHGRLPMLIMGGALAVGGVLSGFIAFWPAKVSENPSPYRVEREKHLRRDHEIGWRDFSDSAFEEARRQGKLVLLDLTAVWCHWCHVMDETTYSDPKIIALIKESFIPVRVDADQRPDVTEKYLFGGWPTTAFLTADKDVLFSATYLPPQNFAQTAEKVREFYRDHRKDILARREELISQVKRTEYEKPKTEDSDKTPERILEGLQRSFDERHGGFGGEPKFPQPESVSLLFRVYSRTKEKWQLAAALKSLDGYERLSDPLWGGFYRYATRADWGEPHFEKMLYVQAGMLRNFAEAYRATGNAHYRKALEKISIYLQRFLLSPEGGFYASQDADAGSHESQRSFVEGETYYTLSEKERLARGIPHVDKSIFTDGNGALISALALSYEVTQDDNYLLLARNAARFILEHARGKAPGEMRHQAGGAALPHLSGRLSDEIYFGMGLLDLYRVTGEASYLEEARKIADFLLKTLRHAVAGFRASRSDARDPLARRPISDNGLAASFFQILGRLTAEERFSSAAEECLKWLAAVSLSADVGLALEEAQHPALKVVIVGEDEKAIRDLHQVALRLPSAKFIRLISPGSAGTSLGSLRFPNLPQAAAYLCTETVCSAPLKTPQELIAFLQKEK